MKSFFKKIALMLALVMVVTMLPARAASAADDDGPQMYPTLKFYLGGDETGKYSDDARYAKTWNKDGYDVVGQFVSSDPEVATVNRRGLVTPVKVGTATITATFKSTTGGEDVVRECKVTVKKNAVKAGISDNSAAALEKGVEVGANFQAVTYREDADGNRVWKGTDVITSPARFESSNPEIFTVTKKGGYIKGVAVGEATLRVWAVQSEGRLKNEDGSWGEYRPVTDKAEYTVKVVAPGPDVVEYDRAKLTVSDTQLQADGVSGTLVTFTLYSGPNTVDKETKDVQVRLETTRGTLAFTNVTLENGSATVLYTTPILTAEATALISATIISAEDTPEGQALINTQAAPVEIRLVPAIGVDDNAGASVVSSTVVTADRITLYFNKPVTRESFMWLYKGRYVMTENDKGEVYKFSLEIDDNIDQIVNEMRIADFTEKDVVNILQNTDTSLTFVLEDHNKLYGEFVKKLKLDADGDVVVDGNGEPVWEPVYDENGDKKIYRVLTDNSRYALNFIDERYTAGVNSANVIGYVTDAVLPSLLSVTQYQDKSLTQIVLTFSEPIPYFSTDLVSIDGMALSGSYAEYSGYHWGIEGTTSNNRYPNTSTDSRNMYVIKLGKDADNNQRYFDAGRHSLTVNNVGDYAERTDSSNKIATATLDFYIKANDVVPSYTVEVQSPEQYLVRFNCLVWGNHLTPDGTWFSNSYKETLGSTSESPLELQYNDRGQWKDVNDLGQDYSIVDLTEADDEVSTVLIEVKTDWTKVLQGAGKNYYNYDFRLHTNAGTIKNVANGKLNGEINIELTDSKMKTVDTVSPSIVGEVKEITSGYEFNVQFDEPIQLTGSDLSFDVVKKAGNITPSSAQGTSVPVITAQFVSKTNLDHTVDAVITDIDRQNYTLTIKTLDRLKAGKEYTLYVRSVSDDIGNTALTLSKDFVTEGVEEVPFRIVGVWADTQLIAGTGIYDLNPYDKDDTTPDAIYVEFSRSFSRTGGVDSVLANTNWSINGYPLPTGSYIIGNIIGDSRLTGVTIILPNGTITNIDTTIVTLSKNVKDVDGRTLSGENRVKTQYPLAVRSAGYNGHLAGRYLGEIGKHVALSQDNRFNYDIATGAAEKIVSGSSVQIKFDIENIEGINKDTYYKDAKNQTVPVFKRYDVSLYAVVIREKKEVEVKIGKDVKVYTIDEAKNLIFVCDDKENEIRQCKKFIVRVTARSNTGGQYDSSSVSKEITFK